MPATPKTIEITDEMLAGGGSYADVEVDAEHVATLTDVSDYDSGRSSGWKWSFDIKGANFDIYTALYDAQGKRHEKAMWKLIEVIESFVPDFFSAGGALTELDPNLFIGDEVGAYVNWDKDDDKWDGEEIRYREIKRTFPLAEMGAFASAKQPDQTGQAAPVDLL